MRFELLLFFLLIPLIGQAQSYQKIVFDVEDGMPTHLVKSIERDSVGFLWIGTDEGLVKYNGHDFINFKSATPSRYIKHIIKLSDERLFVVTDLGITQVISSVDTVIFKNVIQGERKVTDGKLFYPKKLFEDSKGNLWVSEPNSVTKLNSEDLTIEWRQEFGSDNSSNSFITSFEFFEHNSDLYTISFTGNIFRYNQEEKKFDPVEYEGPDIQAVSSVAAVGPHVVVGCRQGLLDLSLSGSSFKGSRMGNYAEITSIVNLGDKLLVGTALSEVFIYDIESFETINKFSIYNMKGALITEGGDIWISSDDGVTLLKKNFFRSVTSDQSFVESILPVDDGIYFCSRLELFHYNQSEDEITSVYKSEKGYFLNIIGDEKDFLLSDRSFLHRFRNNELVETIDLSDRGLFIFTLFEDSRGNIWLTQDDTPGILKISPDGSRRECLLEYQSRVFDVLEDDDGNLYFGAIGGDGYIFKYDLEKDDFINISKPLANNDTTRISINDMFYRNDSIWLASSHGLLLLGQDSIRRVTFEDESMDMPVRAINLKNNELWFSNSTGVFNYNFRNDELIKYTEQSGLSSRAANSQGIFIDLRGVKWIATSQGISFSTEKTSDFLRTKKPMMSDISVNGVKRNIANLSSQSIPHGSFMRFVFYSLSLPGNLIEYQYRSDSNEKWESLEKNNYLEVSASQSGKMRIEIRARRQGNYKWSDSRHIEFQVAKPFYLQTGFLIMAIIIIIAVGYLIYTFNRIRIRRLEQRLNRIVNERTEQLRETNRELQQINKELDMFVYSASHDMKAPLSSLSGLINLYKHEQDVALKNELINMMANSVLKLEAFLKEIIDYSKNSRMEVTYEPVVLGEMVEEIIESYRFMENFDQVAFTIEIDKDEKFDVDKSRIRIILNNLISNSIRYCDLKKPQCNVELKVFKKNAQLEIIIEDNGLGIDKKHLPSIYDMFYRASESSTGSGLGLYIIKESVNNLRGKIFVESEVGKGTKFRLIIPMPEEAKETIL